nr:hypothetical protein [uncultured Moellerella sp.]
MKYFYSVFYTLLISFSSAAVQYEGNHYFPSYDATSADKMTELSGKLNFKIGLMYSPCVILSDEYNGNFFVVKLEQCLVNNNNVKIPLQAKVKLLEGSQLKMTSSKLHYTLYSGSNNIYLQTTNIKGSSVIMELDYD